MPHRKFALAFAKSLANGDFDDAEKMLTPKLRNEFSAARLKARYEQMIAYAGKTEATDVEVITSMEEFPQKEQTDVGWAYVSIGGPHPQGGMWSEAVAVVVADRDGELMIREIEWGRP